MRKGISMSYKNAHPEQDPAEGSREVIDRELARQAKKESKSKKTSTADRKNDRSKTSPSAEHRPM
jgi:hypothetical protein